MNREFDDILSERIRELPSYSPSATLWREMETALDMEESISRKLQDLPVHSPSFGTWEAIESALPAGNMTGQSATDLTGPQKKILNSRTEWEDRMHDGRQRTGHRRRVFFLTAAGVAAVALIISTMPSLVRTEQNITVESEVILSEELSTPLTPASEAEDPIEVIEDLCKTGAPICQSELFIEKMQLYRELNEELLQLETVIGQVGDSPEIIKSVIRIENLKSVTLQELIHLIHS